MKHTRSYVVIIENLDPKDGVVGAETEIWDSEAGEEHDHAGIGDRCRLKEDGEKGKDRRLDEERHFRPHNLPETREPFTLAVLTLSGKLMIFKQDL